MASRSFDRHIAEGQRAFRAGPESNDNFEDELNVLNAQAERCRRLAGATYNREVSEILDEMADSYERTAAELSSGKAD